jgi:hypothetical protein
MLSTTTPRIISFSEDSRGTFPRSMFLNEIKDFVEDALQRRKELRMD